MRIEVVELGSAILMMVVIVMMMMMMMMMGGKVRTVGEDVRRGHSRFIAFRAWPVDLSLNAPLAENINETHMASA